MDLLIALNRKKEMVPATASLCKNEAFYCPSCKGKVRLKVGQIKRPHFAHNCNQDCHAFSEGETEEHLQGKLQLATFLKIREKNVQLEAYLPELQQRPDILFEKDHRKTVIEFQCSSISIKRVLERTQGYLNANYDVIWILGNDFNYTNTLTAFHKACLYSSFDNERLMLIHYDVFIDCITVRYDFQTLRSGQMSCQVKQLYLNENQVLKLAEQKKVNLGKIISTDIVKKHERLMTELRYPSPKMKNFLALIYQNQESIVSIPIEIYQCLPSEWMIQTHPMNWKYQFVLWLERFPKYKILTKKMLQLWVNEQIEAKSVVYFHNPWLQEKMCLHPFLEWIEVLERRGTLKKIGHLKWSYQQPLKRYKTLEEKFEMEL